MKRCNGCYRSKAYSVQKTTGSKRRRPIVDPLCLIGGWLIGLWLMGFAGTLASGPACKVSDYTAFILISRCPSLTFYFSAMQGSVFALILVTVLMPVCHHLFEKEHGMIPPGWKRRMHFRRSHSTG